MDYNCHKTLIHAVCPPPIHPVTQYVLHFSGGGLFLHVDNFFVVIAAVEINSTLYYRRVFLTC